MSIRAKFFTRNKKGEEGIVMVMALMMGVVLIAGATALLIRQMMAQKIGVYSSYQQIAENAAVNGFNRILGTINSPSNSYGYLLLLDNGPAIDSDAGTTSENYLWEFDSPSLDEYCTNTSVFPSHPSGNGWYWPTGRATDDAPDKSIPLQTIGANGELTTLLREDNSHGLEPSFKLRSYKLINFEDETGQGKGVFEVEGILSRTRESADGSQKKELVARSLMTRYLDIFASVDAPKNWGVIAAEVLNLSTTTIHGDGLVALIRRSPPASCNGLIPGVTREQSSATPGDPLVWPINRGLPTAQLFKGDETQDVVPGTAIKRVWNFDDREPEDQADRGETCKTIACTRSEADSVYDSPPLTDDGSSTATIKISHNNICSTDLDSDVCHIYVEHMYLTKTKVLIESTGASGNSRKIVIHLALPGEKPVTIGEGGSIVLSGNSQLCASEDVDSTNPECASRPEEFVIASSSAMRSEWYSPQSCSDTTNSISIERNTLPSAWLAMAEGSVNLTDNTSLNGVIWSRSICSNGHDLDIYTTDDLNITSSDQSSARDLKDASYVYDAANAWSWDQYGFRGYGKSTIRGLRGDGLDTFQRF